MHPFAQALADQSDAGRQCAAASAQQEQHGHQAQKPGLWQRTQLAALNKAAPDWIFTCNHFGAIRQIWLQRLIPLASVIDVATM
jgi:hypothetical protein